MIIKQDERFLQAVDAQLAVWCAEDAGEHDGCNVEVVGEDGGKLSKVCSTAYKPRYCPYCGAKVVE